MQARVLADIKRVQMKSESAHLAQQWVDEFLHQKVTVMRLQALS